MTEPTAPDLTFTDTETTSLVPPWTPHGRRVWEVGMIRRTPAGACSRMHLLIRDIHLGDANAQSLEVGGFHQRHPAGGGTRPAGARLVTEAQAAHLVAEFTAGSWLAAANANFDLAGLEEMLVRRRVVDPLTPGPTPFPWHHHSVDVLSWAAGVLGCLQPPWSTRRLAVAAGVPRDAAGPVHTAMADAEWCVLLWEALLARPGDTMALVDAVQGPPA